MSEHQENIEKPWAVYSFMGELGIARVVEEDENSVKILNSEYQSKAGTWYLAPLERFDTDGEAIDYILKKRGEHLKDKLELKLHEHFPSLFQK